MAASYEPSRAEERLNLCVVALAGLTPMLALLSPLGLAPLLIVTMVVMLTVGPRSNILAAIPRGPAILAAVFLLWAAISAFWAVDWVGALRKSGQLSVLFAAGLVLLGATRIVSRGDMQGRAATALAFGVGLTSLLFVVEVAFGGPIARVLTTGQELEVHTLITRHNRAATVIAILLLPAAAVIALRFDVRWAVVCGLAGVVILLLMRSRTAIVAVGASACIAVAALWWPVLVRRLVIAGFVLALAFPFGINAVIPSDPAQVAALRDWSVRHQVLSAFHRLRIWEFAAKRMEDRPVLGWGLDSSRVLPGAKDPTDAAGEVMPLHPHNAPVQIRLELGILGLLLAAAIVIWPLVTIRRLTTRNRAVVLAAASAAMIVASMSYGIWQSWWVAALWLCAGLVPLALEPDRGQS